MTSLELLPIVLAFEVTALVLIIASLFWISESRARFERRHEAAMTTARRGIAEMLATDTINDAVRGSFAALPRSLQIRLVWELAPKLVGDSRALLAELATHTGIVAWAEHACTSRKWYERLQGIRVLTLLQRYHEAAKRLLDDPHPSVRAQALEWAADHPSGEMIRRIIEHFDDPSHLCLFTSQDGLLRVGNPAIPHLVEYLTDDRLESPAPAMDVACGLADPRFLGIALKFSYHTEPVVRAKAVGLLAGIGGDAPISRLLELIDDADGRVRAAVARGFSELGHWAAAPAVASLLRDSQYEVRRDAGLALQHMGSPGRLMLRKFRTDGDQFAADMATQVLDLPQLEAPVPR